MSLLDLLKKKKQDIAAQAGRRKTLKLSDGTGRYRILPSWRGGKDEQFWHDFGQHFVKNEKKEMQAVYICADKTFGRPCEVCDAVKSAIKSASDDATLELLKEAQASGRVLVNALHLDGPTPGEVQILELPPTVFGQIVDILTEWTEAGEAPLDPAKGKDLLISRTGTGKNTKYTVQVAAKTTVVSADVMSKLHNLDEYVAQESAEGQVRALNSVRTVAGLLAAPASRPAAAGRLPSSASKGADLVLEDEYAAAPPPRRAAPAPAVEDAHFDDVPELDTAAAAAPVAADAGTGDAELDDLLAKLG